MLADAAMLSMVYRKISEDGKGPSLVPRPTRYRTKTGEKLVPGSPVRGLVMSPMLQRPGSMVHQRQMWLLGLLTFST